MVEKATYAAHSSGTLFLEKVKVSVDFAAHRSTR
jgi:hypothetical protein